MNSPSPFVGRGEAIALLAECYHGARSGRGCAVIVRGEAGIGKTRLLTEFRETVARDDSFVVVAKGLDYAPSPFGPIVQIIDNWQELRPELFRRVSGLREAVNIIVHADRAGTRPDAGERRHAYDGIARLFRLAASDAPTTVMVDDLQFADSATLQLLFHISETGRDVPLCIVATVRSTPLTPSNLRVELARWYRNDRASFVELGGLSDYELESLVRTAADSRVARELRIAICRRSEGNPLFAEELVRQAIAGDSAGAQNVPRSLGESIVVRLESLPPDARKTIEAASALGDEFNVRAISLATVGSQEAILAHLRSAMSLGLVLTTADPQTFRFRHAITREAVYGELLEAQRRDLHCRIYEGLSSDAASANLGVLAFHAYASGNRMATTRYCESAGDEAAKALAVESAVLHFSHALAACTPSDAGRLATKLASAYLVAGHPERALEPAERAFAFYQREASVSGASEACLLRAEIADQLGEDEDRLEHLAVAAVILEHATEAALVARRRYCESEVALAERDAQRVIDLTGSIGTARDGDVPLRVAMMNARAHALLMQRQNRAAIAVQIRAVRTAACSEYPSLLPAARFALGEVCALGGDLARAGRAFGQAAKAAAGRFAGNECALGLALQAEMELMRGNVATAKGLVFEALDTAKRSDHPGVIVMTGRVGIFTAIRLEQLPLARFFADSLDLEESFRERTPEAMFRLSGAYAQYLLLCGRSDEAQRVLKRAVARVTSRKRLRSTDWSVCSMFTVAVAGDAGDAAAARRPFEDWYSPLAPGLLSLFDALVAERAGDLERAAALADAAIEPLERYSLPYERAMALSLSGRKMEALTVCEQHRFLDVGRRIRQELTPKNRRGRAPNDLTPRELEIAERAGSGLTNRVIADTLYVTEKTVETHLASVFRKLHVTARSDLADRLKNVDGKSEADDPRVPSTYRD